MFKSYFPARHFMKTVWRNLSKNKFSSFINIGGLAVGMAVGVIIALWIYDELSFNHYFKNYGNIGKVMVKWQKGKGANASQPMPLAIQLRNSYPDDFKHVVMSTQPWSYIISSGEKAFTQNGMYMQPEAADMFSLKILSGSGQGLKDVHSILLAQSLAKKIFADTDPVNRILTIDNKQSVKVSGVYEDFPTNTEFSGLTFIAPWDLYVASNDWMKARASDWNNNFLYIYTQLRPGKDFNSVSAKIKEIKTPHVVPEEAAAKPSVFIHPMRKWHLYSSFGESGISETSEQLRFIWIYGVIGVFVLLLACINFMNLSTARSEKRAKEVGIRKTLGSARSQLIRQFFSESLLVTAFAFLLAVLIVVVALPWFNNIAGKQIHILWMNAWFWLAGTAFVFITGMLAGSYPAFYLSSFKAVKVLKGTFRVGKFAFLPRKILVVMQFTVSIALVIGTLVIYRQVQYAKNRPVGYTKSGLLMYQMVAPDSRGKFQLLQHELMKTAVVSDVAASLSPVTGVWSANSGFTWKDKQDNTEQTFGTLAVTQEYGKTVGWQFVQGRDFSKDMPTDSSGFVINEAALKVMGLKNPLGEVVHTDNGWFTGGNFRILGVVKDMVMNSPFDPAYPTMFFLKREADQNWILMRLKPNISTAEALPKIEAVFRKLIPSAPFDYKFADDEYATKFAAEERVQKLASVFSVLAIIISCLGLFGMISFIAEQRTKEIGIRKILGASVFGVWQLLSAEFVLMVSIAFLIAAPLAYYFMHEWLQGYQYKTNLSWWVFATGGAGALLITLITISSQSIKAAITNPVKSLRTE
ncbi:MAG: ABC transporter permease [Williamsia sp.]|nr:ABC transporter permease [Williamsia sp.]